MSAARIYQRTKNAMQSGRARAGQWVLEYEPAEAKRPDPLTGWAGSGDTRGQVSLVFPSLDAARAYADTQGLKTTVVPAAAKQLRIRTYAENFR
ncbi:ETC complex I subunit conserved region [Sphingomonas laterariae]|uniref:ETC complex I subunit conserved region n=1 Tax=Edaphosphingomonas laterariae TaxID=861865 RepID=A0A239DLP7_9SPHN|nr:ETC complex I subunit [Sphingomonas laterariae]SNS32991.1 ETC complex I subunit conserved region [Sphingomonas laterariae]